MSKNILVVGAGNPDKFGQHFVKKTREEGNRVIVFSHKNHNTSNVDDRHINYNDTAQVKNKCVEADMNDVEKAFNSEEFINIVDAINLTSNKYNYNVIKLFKKDFWKEFL